MENRKLKTKKRLILFVIFAIGLGWLTFLMIPFLGVEYGQMSSTVFLIIAMFVPTISNILTRLITKEGFQNMYLRPNFKGNIKAYLLVFFGPTILLFLSAAFYFLIFPGNFDSELTMVKASGIAGISPINVILIMSLQVIILGPIINIIPTLGEELGWRGYLLPKLQEFFSDRKALVITGAIWGIWHLPAIVMGHNYGTNYIGYPVLGILAMIIFCIVLGIIEGYATIKLKSAVPAAMIHSTVNAGAGFPIVLAKGGYNTLLGPAITGLIGGLPFLIVAVILFIKIGKREIKTEI
ncbi:MAG: CPBP family intramembrane glutamic endopeptidase [Desulfitobacteriia bacterium]|jgi:membrane protease YdiL (CAAX protease family)